jgi:hypothetical protein
MGSIHQSSPLKEARPGPHGSAGAHLDREARSGVEEHVTAPELSSRGGRARSHETRDSVGAHLDREARFEAEKHVAASELNSARRRGPSHVTRGGTGAHLSKEVRSRAAGHVTALEPTSVGRCGLKLQLMWQRVDARSTPCLNLELICGGTRSLGCRQYQTLHAKGYLC